MIKCVISIILCCSFCISFGQNPDLPGPSANLQTLPSGSYVIPMDNTLQLGSNSLFNLKSYGLAVYLLYNNVKLQWVIKAGKAKDGIDFTGTAELMKPTLVAGGSSKNFKAGPFVIKATDTSGVAALIESFYSSNSLTGADRPNVYRLTASASNVDIRYDLTGFQPKAAILTDGGKQSIHVSYMQAAAVPASAYATSPGTDLLSNCYTFASEPHNTATGTAVDDAITAIKDFVTKGGNFLAQCEAIRNYENNSLGRFQTTTGVSYSSATVSTSVNFANPDLSFSQIEGAFNANHGGSLQVWTIDASSTNNRHDHITGTGGNAAVLTASVSKHYYNQGGLVFYLGNHNFTLTTDIYGVNGLRMYMNAFLTPSNSNCPILTYVTLGAQFAGFQAQLSGTRSGLSWTVKQNELIGKFVIEKSLDGAKYLPVTNVAASPQTGNQVYQYHEEINAPKAYYRIKLVTKEGYGIYSAVATLNNSKSTGNALTILNSVEHENLLINYQSASATRVNLRIVNSAGSLVYQRQFNCVQGTNIFSVDPDVFKSTGIYFVEAVNDQHQRLVGKAVRTL